MKSLASQRKQRKADGKQRKAKGEEKANQWEGNERIFLPRFGTFQGVARESKLNRNSQAPPLDFRENWPPASIDALIDSYSFVVRFAFVLKRNPLRRRKRPKIGGCLGVTQKEFPGAGAPDRTFAPLIPRSRRGPATSARAQMHEVIGAPASPSGLEELSRRSAENPRVARMNWDMTVSRVNRSSKPA